MNQNYIHDVSEKELYLWLMFGSEKHKNIDFYGKYPKMKICWNSTFVKHVSIAI